MKSVIKLLALASAMAAAVPFSAQAMEDPSLADLPCHLELSADNNVQVRGPYGRGYEVFSESESFENLGVSIRHVGGPCRFYIAIAAVDPANATLAGQGQSLRYDILKSSYGSSALSSDFLGNESARLEGEFTEGAASFGANLVVNVPARQFVRGGTYDGQVAVRLFRLVDSRPELIAEAPVRISTQVLSALKVQSDLFPGNLREGNIDLGELSYGASRSVEFEVTSNAAVSVVFHSANLGKLRHHAGAPGIAYRVLAQGQEIDLASQAGIARLMTGQDGPATPMQIEVKVPESARTSAAGLYNDVLNVTFRAEE